MTGDPWEDQLWRELQQRLGLVERYRPAVPNVPQEWLLPQKMGKPTLTTGRLYSGSVPTALGAIGLTIVVALLGTAYLTSVGTAPSVPTVPLSSADTGIQGSVLISGGPHASIHPVGLVTLTVSNDAGVTVRRDASPETSVTITVPPGRYVVSATYGSVTCSSEAVDVTAGALTSFSVMCQVK